MKIFYSHPKNKSAHFIYDVEKKEALTTAEETEALKKEVAPTPEQKAEAKEFINHLNQLDEVTRKAEFTERLKNLDYEEAWDTPFLDSYTITQSDPSYAIKVFQFTLQLIEPQKEGEKYRIHIVGGPDNLDSNPILKAKISQIEARLSTLLPAPKLTFVERQMRDWEQEMGLVAIRVEALEDAIRQVPKLKDADLKKPVELAVLAILGEAYIVTLEMEGDKQVIKLRANTPEIESRIQDHEKLNKMRKALEGKMLEWYLAKVTA